MNTLSKKTLRSLSSKGITVLSTTLIPDSTSSMPWANASVGFNVSDNGTGRVLTLSQILARA
jgi:hypothetical protein